jgi:outer membrane protein
MIQGILNHARISFLVFLWALAARPQAADSLTLDGAIAAVLAQHPSITQAQAALGAARAHTLGMESVLYPSVSASLADAYSGPDYPILFGTKEFNLMPPNSFDARVSADYTLYDFGKRASAISVSRSGEASAADRVQSVRIMLAYQTVQLFAGILFLEKNAEVADTGVAALDRHLEIVKKKRETGSTTDYDVLKSEVQCAAARSQCIDIANELGKKLTVLGQLLGRDANPPLRLKGGFDLPRPTLATDSLVKCAFAGRPDYAEAKHAKESARLQYEAALREANLVVGCRASAGFRSGLPDRNLDMNTPRFNWSAGVQASVPLLDGKRIKNHALEATCNENAAAAAIMDLERKIKTETLQAKSDIEAAFAKLGITEAQVHLAEQSLAQARLKYDAGVITNQDVLDAENDYVQAQFGYLQSRYRCFVSQYELDQATGNRKFLR